MKEFCLTLRPVNLSEKTIEVVVSAESFEVAKYEASCIVGALGKLVEIVSLTERKSRDDC
jgi:hypothetical protein